MRDDGTYSERENKANAYLIKKYFPDDDPTKDTEEMRTIKLENVQYTERHELDITKEEISDVISSLKKKKVGVRSHPK